MATLTSHVLDSVQGGHAANVRIELEQVLDGVRTTLFDVVASEEGRISENVDVKSGARYELTFHSAAYFRARGTHPDGRQIIEEVVIRLAMPDPDERYHIPMMMAPHAYSLWWSE